MALTHALLDITPLRSTPMFRRLWIGGMCSALGSQMTVVAVLFQVWDTTGSVYWTGAVGLAHALPIILFGLFAGALVDRHDRRRLYLLATGGLAVCAALLAVQGFTGGLPVAGLLLLLAVQSCFGVVAGPASRTFLTRLLPTEQVAAGLALNRVAGQTAMLAGPALGGLVAGGAGVGACYLIDAATFVIAFAAAFRLPPMRMAGQAPGPAAVIAGLRFIVHCRPVRAALLTDLAAMMLSMPLSLFPLINAERFGNDPRTLGLFLTAIAVGGVAASALSGTFTRLPRPGLVMLTGSATWGAAIALFGVAPDAWTGLALLALAGTADTVAVVSRSTVVQLHTPDALLGRVTAAEHIVGSGGPNIGNLRAGIVAGLTSGTTALVSGGLLAVVAVALIGRYTPELRHRP